MRDLAIDALRALTRRPQRSFLTMLGVVLGVGALVAIIGLAQSGALQIARRFDAFAATAVQVTLPTDAVDEEEGNLIRQLSHLPGVQGAGTFTPVTGTATAPVLASSVRSPEPMSVPLIVASAEGMRAAEPIVRGGRLPTGWAESHDSRLAVVGEGVARSLGVWPESGLDLIHLNRQPFTVVAVVTDRGIGAELLSSVMISREGGGALSLVTADRTLLVRTQPGAGQTVARWAPLAVYPENPAAVIAQVPPDPTQLRGRITSDTKNLLFALAVVTLVVGAVGIGNTMLTSLWERRPEIGLRRALGSSRLAVGTLFLVESGLVGTAGGILGAAAGVLLGGSLSVARDWVYALPTAVLAAPFLGAAVGLVAGLYPALRAARVDPVESLRS